MNWRFFEMTSLEFNFKFSDRAGARSSFKSLFPQIISSDRFAKGVIHLLLDTQPLEFFWMCCAFGTAMVANFINRIYSQDKIRDKRDISRRKIYIFKTKRLLRVVLLFKMFFTINSVRDLGTQIAKEGRSAVQGYTKGFKCVRLHNLDGSIMCKSWPRFPYKKVDWGSVCGDVLLVRKQGFFLLRISVTYHIRIFRDAAHATN